MTTTPTPTGDKKWNVCRCQDGPNLSLVCSSSSSSSSSTSLSTSQLERALTRRLATEEEWEELVHEPRNDVHWLLCQPARIWPLLTITGILEDSTTATANANDNDDEQQQDPKIQLTVYHREETSLQQQQQQQQQEPSGGEDKKEQKEEEDEAPSSVCCSCRAPMSDWKRQPLTTTTNNAKDGHDGVHRLAWLDFRNNHNEEDNTHDMIVKSPSGALHFLRSILGIDHAVSPWTNYNTGDIEADIVVVVVSQPHPALQGFRVSNAAPSWFLHAVATCESLEREGFWNLLPTTGGDHPGATLYIYKRLAPRPLLSSSHAENPQAALIKGCLWETVTPSQQEHERNETNGNENITTGAAPFSEPIYRMTSPPYVNVWDEYGLETIQPLFRPDALAVFTKEALRIPQWTPWPETQHYSTGGGGNDKPWTVFPLCYCFPAHQPENLTWVEVTRRFCPETCALLENSLGPLLRTALFSQLAPETTLEAHTGWSDLANHVLRLHIPLIVPPGNVCGTWVDGCVDTHQQGKPLLFDDSKIHRAYNYSPTQSRIVLIVDLARPPHLPVGTAVGGHTDQLDQFIQQMSRIG